MHTDPHDTPQITEKYFAPIDRDRLLRPEISAHAPRILILYGSLRERSFSRLAAEEAGRILLRLGAEVRISGRSSFFGGALTLVVSDTLKSAVVCACFHEPAVNRSYTELAQHDGTAILPARPYKPKAKSRAEGGVLLVQRWIVAKLRNQAFFSLEELNAAIRETLLQLKAFRL
ncbi:NADPH-dependent FMN reductase [Roseinatronobacter thiooxidans]|uniref:NADPH-dependent FMN reductase n=1 Tax=Roseinatronobacter thiooxidans TaxID=121821 RepID=A0A2W7PYJ2_9RHOB|nr:NAD(P)H-dependent oxidoreductase [Roseinatronobacter thiooxidans]PZX38920.1 NADPH-dependent FMN reductase [Roseinatronobacter thiooxidans]